MTYNIKTFQLTGSDYSWMAEGYDDEGVLVARVKGYAEVDVKTRIEDYLSKNFNASITSNYSVTI